MAPNPPDESPTQQSGSANTVVVRCAVPAPLYRELDYLPPDTGDSAQGPLPGSRIRVPLGSRSLVGVVLGCRNTSAVDPEKLKRAEAIIDHEPLVDEQLLKLLEWAARYYLHPIGETLVLGLSPRERRGEPPAATGRPGFALNARGRGLPAGALGRAKKQARLIELLQGRPRSVAELEAEGISRAIIRAVQTKALIEPCEISVAGKSGIADPLPANAEQQRAIDAITAQLKGFRCHLLEGITGSGKTEVYLQCIAPVLAAGDQVLVILPEIGLTPQMVARFESRFATDIAVLHSGLSDSERDRNWSLARRGEAGIVLGTRSSVFAPTAKLGLIIVDEEHDQSLNQQDGLRYSARDVAVKRAHISNCPVILGSATPSLESLANAEAGRYHGHRLSSRAGGARTPTKSIIDIRGLDLAGGLSGPLGETIDTVLARGEQALLFLNRRGFAPAVLCHDCGWTAECGNCDARLTLHQRPAELRCHHCNQRRHLPRLCPSCQSGRLVSAGIGTEQTEQALGQRYPSTPIFRVDSDSMTGRHAMAEFTEQLKTAGPCIILGTQMLSKGHHFPRVTCVGVLDADSLLFNPDFRGEERLLQLLTQVGGRSGRGELPGEVVIQTRHPDHPLLQAVLEQPYGDLARQLLAERSSRGLPPAGAIAVIRCDARQQEDGVTFLTSVYAKVEASLPSVNLIGPVPSAMARRAGLYRSQLIAHGRNRRDVQRAAQTLLATASSLKSPAGLRWFMDVDPVESL